MTKTPTYLYPPNASLFGLAFALTPTGDGASTELSLDDDDEVYFEEEAAEDTSSSSSFDLRAGVDA